FVLDPAALNSVACKREYGYAADLGKPILPILVSEGGSTNLLPPSLSQIEFVDYRNQDRTAALRLARAFSAVPPPAPLPDPLPVPPEAPLSYLGSLAAKVEATSLLTYEEQSVLVVDLKRGLRDPQTADDTQTLLKMFRKRRDLLAYIAQEIDELFEGLRETSYAQGAPSNVENSFVIGDEKAELAETPDAPPPEPAAVRPPESESKDLPEPSESARAAAPGEPKETEADATSGDAAAQNTLGVRYQNGEGVPKDLGKAIELFQKAADNGHAPAQCNLGALYQYGWGVPKDRKKARQLYQKAAEQGHAEAQCNLGALYEFGWGVPKDSEKAADLYKRAVEQGDTSALTRLGYLYQSGEGVPEDLR